MLLLLVSTLPLAVPAVEAANERGPLLAAWKASELVGVPYRSGGEDPVKGMDNSGLVYYSYQALGVDMPRSLTAQASFGSAVRGSELAVGDLVFFRSPSYNRVRHVGIYLGDGVFVASASATDGVRLRDINSSYYRQNYLGARRVSSAEFPPLTQLIGEQAISSLGIKYLAGGATSRGLDNVGLVKYIYRQFFLSVPDTLSELAATGVAVERDRLRAGDMVFFRSETLNKPYRVGMYVGDDQFVITSEAYGQVVRRSLRDSFNASRYLGSRRPYASFLPPVQASLPSQPVPPVEPAPEPKPAVAEQIIALALENLGKPYVLGADGPNAFDCSGLTQYVFAKFGYDLPRTSYNQATVGSAVAFDQLRKGDLVFFKDTWRNDGRVDHVAIYLGDGQVVHAISSGVQVSRLQGYWVDHYSWARRVLP